MAEAVPLDQVLPKLQIIIGQQAIQIAVLQAQVELLQRRLAVLESERDQRHRNEAKNESENNVRGDK